MRILGYHAFYRDGRHVAVGIYQTAGMSLCVGIQQAAEPHYLLRPYNLYLQALSMDRVCPARDRAAEALHNYSADLPPAMIRRLAEIRDAGQPVREG